MQLGVFLKRFRKKVFISGEKLAKKIGVKRHSLEKWENSGVMPNYQSAIKIEEYFRIKSLKDIPENVLQDCIARELNHSSFNNGEKKLFRLNLKVDKNLFNYLLSIEERINNIEKLLENHKG